jgi:broad specificity phosphatase PhoE
MRHGELQASERRLLRGQAEAELSERGRRQEQALVRWFLAQGHGPERVFSSDLKRCQSLGQALAQSAACPLELVPDLREQHLGQFEGRDWEELSVSHPEAVRAYWADYAETRPPGGENLRDVQKRASQFLEAHAESWLGQRVALVTHAGVLRVLLCHMLGLPVDRALRFAPPTGSVSVLSHSSAGFVIESLFLVPPELPAQAEIPVPQATPFPLEVPGKPETPVLPENPVTGAP